MIEYKIKAVAEEMVRQSNIELNSKLTNRTKQIKDYIDVKLNTNGSANQSMQSNLKEQHQYRNNQSHFFTSGGPIDVSGSDN